MTTGEVIPCDLRSSSRESPSLPGMTTSERIRSKCREWASSSALAALSHTVASWPARRKARESEASVLASSSTISKCAMSDACGGGAVRYRKLDAEGGSAARLALYRDGAAMIAHHGLNNGQAQAGAVLFSCVVGRKQPVAFFFRQALAGVGYFENHRAIVLPRPDAQFAAIRHGVHGVQHQVLQRALDLFGISLNRGQARVELDLRMNGPARRELRLQQPQDRAHQLVQLHRLELRRGHFGEIAEPADDGF